MPGPNLETAGAPPQYAQEGSSEAYFPARDYYDATANLLDAEQPTDQYAQGGELVTALRGRAETAQDVALSEDACYELDSCYGNTQEFLNQKPRGEHDNSADIARLPADSPVTHTVLQEVQQTLWAEPVAQTDTGFQYHTTLRGVFLRDRVETDKETGEQQIVLSLERSPEHGQYRAKFDSHSPKHRQAEAASLRYAHLESSDNRTDTIPNNWSPNAVASGGIGYADTQPMAILPHHLTAATQEKPTRHPPTEPISKVTADSLRDTGDMPVLRVPEFKAARNPHETTGDVFVRLSNRIGEAWQHVPAIKTLADNMGKMFLYRHPDRRLTEGTDPKAERAARDQLEHAIKLAANFLTPPPPGREAPHSVQLLGVSSEVFDPAEHLDTTNIRTLRELEAALGAQTRQATMRHGRTEDGRRTSTLSMPTNIGATLTCRRVQGKFKRGGRFSRHGNREHGNFEVWLERDSDQ